MSPNNYPKQTIRVVVHIGERASEVLRIRLHEDYVPYSFTDDLALLWLLDISDAEPACFPYIKVLLTSYLYD